MPDVYEVTASNGPAPSKADLDKMDKQELDSRKKQLHTRDQYNYLTNEQKAKAENAKTTKEFEDVLQNDNQIRNVYNDVPINTPKSNPENGPPSSIPNA